MAFTYQMTENVISDAITEWIKDFSSTPTEVAMTYNVAPRIVQRRFLQQMGS